MVTPVLTIIGEVNLTVIFCICGYYKKFCENINNVALQKLLFPKSYIDQFNLPKIFQLILLAQMMKITLIRPVIQQFYYICKTRKFS